MTACDNLFTRQNSDMNVNNTTHDEVYLNDRMESEDSSWILGVGSQRDTAVSCDTQVLTSGQVTKPQLLLPPNHITCITSITHHLYYINHTSPVLHQSHITCIISITHHLYYINHTSPVLHQSHITCITSIAHHLYYINHTSPVVTKQNPHCWLEIQDDPDQPKTPELGWI